MYAKYAQKYFSFKVQYTYQVFIMLTKQLED
jgi:hypothetical protein